MRKPAMLQGTRRPRNRYTNSVITLPLVGIACALVAVDGKQRPVGLLEPTEPRSYA